MTNLTPTQICSRLVELDILVPDMRGMSLDCYSVPGRPDLSMTAERAVSDWSVAGACVDAWNGPQDVVEIGCVDSAACVTFIRYAPDGDEEAEPARFVGHDPNNCVAICKAFIAASAGQPND